MIFCIFLPDNAEWRKQEKHRKAAKMVRPEEIIFEEEMETFLYK